MRNFIGRFAVLGALLGCMAVPASAQGDAVVQVASGVSYQFLERWDVDRLN